MIALRMKIWRRYFSPNDIDSATTKSVIEVTSYYVVHLFFNGKWISAFPEIARSCQQMQLSKSYTFEKQFIILTKC